MNRSRLGVSLLISSCLVWSAAADTINVPADHTTIQAAIGAALPGDEVVVAPGTYVETIDLLGKAITLRSSAGPDTTWIDGDTAGSVVTCSSGEGTGTILEGFTITGGYGTVDPYVSGGGMYILNSSPTVIDCVFRDNVWADRGAGLYCSGSSSTIVGCVLVNNDAPGTWGGGGIFSELSSLTVQGCLFEGNLSSTGGGMFSQSSDWVSDCRFIGNTATGDGGAIAVIGATTTLFNCVFSGNTANNGGAMFSQAASSTVTNCSFVRNTAALYAGGYYGFHNSTATFVNSIFWENEDSGGTGPGAQMSYDGSVTDGCTIRHCTIQSGIPGSVTDGGHNLHSDPMFLDPDGPDDVDGTADDDLRLLEHSPCIDVGSNAAVPQDILDLDGDSNLTEPYPFDFAGNPRFADDLCVSNRGTIDPIYPGMAIVDIGAVEHLEPPTADADNDGKDNCNDNCPDHANADQADCDGDGFGDVCAIALQVAYDCNGNTVPDDCDLAAGTATDADMNGIPDSCQYPLFVDADATAGGDGLTWATAMDDLEVAIDFTRSNRWASEIRVAEGTYRPSQPSSPADPRTARFELRASFILRGGYAGQGAPDPDQRDPVNQATILSGDLAADDVVVAGPDFDHNGENAYHVLDAAPGAARVAIDGLTIVGGHANGSSTFDHDSGGGLRVLEGTLTMTNCTFSTNAAKLGAGLAVHDATGAVITGCHFIENTSTSGGGGGGISLYNSNATLTDCSFVDNASARRAGALYDWYGDVQVTNGIFIGNSAENGGAVYSYGSDSLFRDCLFLENDAIGTDTSTGWGGAIATYEYCQPQVFDSTFVANTATSGGGALSVNRGDGLDLTGSTFVNNLAKWGAALIVQRRPGDVISCTFAGNRAITNGGAVNLSWSQSAVAFTNCLMAGNRAPEGGAVISNYGGRPTLVGTTIVDNLATTAGGGILNNKVGAYAGVCIVGSSVLWGNSPQQIVNDSGCTTTVSYSCVAGGYAGSGNITDNPRAVGDAGGSWSANATYDPDTGQTTFIDDTASWIPGEFIGKLINPDVSQAHQSVIVANTTTTINAWGDYAGLGTPLKTYQVNDYRMLIDSPGVDAGRNSDLPAGITTDLAGNPRITDGDGDANDRIDMGAYERLPHGDSNADETVDLQDHALFADCIAGPAATPGSVAGVPESDCRYFFDFNVDAFIDLEDFSVLQELLAAD